MTMQLHAVRKGWPLETAMVTLEHYRDYVDDCRHCEQGQPKRLDHIDEAIFVRGPLVEEQADRLVEVAGKSPVHRTLQSEVRIATKREKREDDRR